MQKPDLLKLQKSLTDLDESLKPVYETNMFKDKHKQP